MRQCRHPQQVTTPIFKAERLADLVRDLSSTLAVTFCVLALSVA